MKRWLFHPVQSFNRVFVCPFWEHRPFGQYGWSPAYHGKWDKQQAVLGTCERCGEYAGTQ